MNRAYEIIQKTTLDLSKGALVYSKKAKNYTVAKITPLILRLAKNSRFKKYLQKAMNKNSTLYTYIQWTKDVTYVILILFSAFVIVKSFKTYK